MSYSAAKTIAASTTAKFSRNKGVMIVNDGGGATEADVFFRDEGANVGPEVTIKAVANHNPIIIPIRMFKTGGTQTNCTIYELI